MHHDCRGFSGTPILLCVTMVKTPLELLKSFHVVLGAPRPRQDQSHAQCENIFSRGFEILPCDEYHDYGARPCSSERQNGVPAKFARLNTPYSSFLRFRASSSQVFKFTYREHSALSR